ncbi:hypothetical protein FK268_02455 [Tsukamurella sputi]|uniref:Phospholipase n=1 Tax=Tsukamurella sputi TaxID=2591848 RepID=A0A5C5RU66_9ACTN|nr:hypothetical protein [Tsukamurella sputi]TWS26128.1 hypothetical protein FK268_02455 [Tsukamurella sputi]
MNRRMLAAAAVLAVPLSFGISLPASAENSAPAEDAATAAAVRAITAADVGVADQIRSIPSGFAYAAAAGPGYAINPHGECSSVVPLPAEFDAPCKAHDLGYDLLRHADARGRPLGGWARHLLDDTLFARMADTCTARPLDQRRRCTEVAGIAVLAVRANTWRQHDGPPRAESVREITTSWLTAGGRL